MIFRSLLPSVTRSHSEQRLLQTNPKHLFRIINDVDCYSQFLPLCSRSQVLSRSGNSYRATLTVGIPPLFQETYTSHVVADPDRLVITAKSIDSKLFDSLASTWKLRATAKEHECLVDFDVTLTVSDPLVVGALDQILQQVASRQVQAFDKRCREIPDTTTLDDNDGTPTPKQ